MKNKHTMNECLRQFYLPNYFSCLVFVILEFFKHYISYRIIEINELTTALLFKNPFKESTMLLNRRYRQYGKKDLKRG
jgi:hypothetical protein